MALESVYGALEVDSERAEAFESSLFGLLASTADMREGMAAFLEKRSPEFDGR
jgi:enoyl-CoA hydratase/carnithine racemase